MIDSSGYLRNRAASDRTTEVTGRISQMHWSNPTMQVFGPFRVNAGQGPQGPSRLSQARPTDASTPKPSASPVDQLDLSPAARAISSGEVSGPASVGGDMRLDKIASLRRQIADGSYDTPEKMDVALGRLLDDLG